MSYRHSSYRKMSAAVLRASRINDEPPDLTRFEMDRVLHWSNQPPLPKPPGWGVPRRKRASA